MKLLLPEGKVAGQYRFVTHRDPEMKDITGDTGFFDNLITDYGLDYLGTQTGGGAGSSWLRSNFASYIAVGTGTKPEEFTDSSLEEEVAASSSTDSGDGTSSTTSYSRGSYEGIVRAQFPVGAAAGNLSEVACRGSSSSSDPVNSRSLIRDELGSPTTISVREDDYLTVFYKFILLIPKTDTIFNTTVVRDEVPVPTVITARPYDANSTTWSPRNLGSQIGNSTTRLYSGDMVSADASGGPSGRIYGSPISLPIVPYIPGSHERSAGQRYPPGIGTGTIRTVTSTWPFGSWQFQFEPAIEKGPDDSMDIYLTSKWGRA